jgi:tetratricopeptide (TPR) repeat protein
MHVYRAQKMSKEEIERLQKSVGEYISMNSFLSTSIDRQQARLFLSSTNPSGDIEQVFFQIDADPRLKNIKPFSNITLLSYFPREEEVLFMAGSIFRLVKIKRDNDGIWNIRMSLCSENDHQLQSLFQHMKNELSIGQTNLFQFGHILRKMGKLNDAEKYYHRYLYQLSYDHPNLSVCYYALGRVTNEKGDYHSSLNFYNKSLEIAMRTTNSDQSNIALTHNGIADVFRKNGDYVRALKSYEKALVIFQKIYGEDHSRVAMCLNNMGLVQEEQHKYSKALEYHWKALTIWEKHLPADHPNLGTSHNNIGAIHQRLGHHDQALKHYNVSLKIYNKSLPPQHPNIAETLENIGLVYENKGDFQQAFFHIDRAAKIYRRSLSSTDPRVIEIDQCIKRISSKLK